MQAVNLRQLTGQYLCTDETRLEVQGLQSTSNALCCDHITVDTDQPLLWMTEFRDPIGD